MGRVQLFRENDNRAEGAEGEFEVVEATRSQLKLFHSTRAEVGEMAEMGLEVGRV